jgi:aminoglycoside/choline kinase family phosphotransferase
VILVDHGIRKANRTAEADAFTCIGGHLYSKGLPVPEIYDADTFAGYVFLEDLGNLDLQTAVQQTDRPETVMALYRSVIDRLIKFSVTGAEHFDTAWCHQSPEYDRSLILENECRYFVEAFLNVYLGLEVKYRDYREEFDFLAANALRYSVMGLMHRDFQSRNIMIKNRSIYFIDFQGARLGPIQYDLASLLIDPYVDLPQEAQTRLLEYGLTELKKRIQFNADNFRRCYRHCCLTRNLQILGAFGYLTRVKSKPHFEKYIPAALRTLKNNLKAHNQKKLPGLNALMNKIVSQRPPA